MESPRDLFCEQCVFYVPTAPLTGDCRRMPPHPMTENNIEWTRWPRVTGAAHWCGEHKRPTPAIGSGDHDAD